MFHTVSSGSTSFDARGPLSPADLHHIGLRRRDDEDVKALLWEIKRLHEALADAGDLFEPLPKVGWGKQQVARWKELVQVITMSTAIVRAREDRRTRFDPSLPDASPIRRRKPERGPVNGYAHRRISQVDQDRELNERERKPQSR